MKRIDYTTKALRQMRKLPAASREEIRRKLELYAGDPAAVSGSVKKLVGTDAFRLRIGDYRAVFSEDAESILVFRVGHRSHVYD